MSKILSTNEIEKIILDYIEDDRKNQAILLNGEWGCGKTFFIKEMLIPQIDKEKYQIFQISLYGVSSIEIIQDMIYGKWIENVVSEKTEKFGPFCDTLVKRIGVFGKGAIQFFESKIGTDGSAAETAKAILEQNIGKHKKPVLVFDDIERCQIDIIELMGFLNNLSENNGYKLILVANEQEIEKNEDDILTALKYEIALNNRLDVDQFVSQKGTSHDGQETIKINREELEKITNHYFARKSTYDRTREKLIGLTIPYNISVEESFDAIISKYITDEPTKVLIKENKEKIVDLFKQEDHRNLRTLIVASISIQDIIMVINQDRFSEKEFLCEEILRIMLYTIYSAIRRANGVNEYVWPPKVRYGFLNGSFFPVQGSKVYGYAFVDEYWSTQCIDREVIHSDIKTRISEQVATKLSIEEREKYQLLSLHRLFNWYLLPDEDVKRLVSEMKTELREKKYVPRDFKDIIITLMQINNTNFGLTPEKSKSFDNTNVTVYDSTNSDQFIDIPLSEPTEEDHIYTDWEKFNISEFVDLMVKYFDDPRFVITKETIRAISDDQYFMYNYRELTMPLIGKIEQAERDKILAGEQGTTLCEMMWDNSFEQFCYDSKDEFANQGRFLSLFEYHKFIERLGKASSEEVHCFCNAVKRVYHFSNLWDIFSADSEIANKIFDYVCENINGDLNKDKSRTKEIALRRFKFDISQYKRVLRTRN